MFGRLRMGGLFAPLLFSLLFTNILIRAETVEIFISARNSLNNAGLNFKDDLLSDNTENRLIIEFIGLSFSRFYFKNGAIIDSFDLNVDDGGSVEALKDFLINADRYADNERDLVIWDHGNGWYNSIGTFAISYDGNTGNSIGIANGELRSVFEYCKNKYGIKFRSIVFDACLMGEIEVMDEIKDFANYCIASPDLVPINSLDYGMILNNTDYFTGLKDEVKVFNDTSCIKFSIINLNEINDFLNEFKNDLSKISDINMGELDYYPDKVSGDSIQCSFRDLINLTGKSTLKTKFNELFYNNRDSSDISVFLPINIESYLSRIDEYRTLLFNSSLRWDSIIFPLYGERDTFPPVVELDSSFVVYKNSVKFKISDFYDFYSDIYMDFYNLKDYSSIIKYDFESSNVPESDGWTRSSGESYEGNYSYFSNGGYITLYTGSKPVFLSLKCYSYNAGLTVLFYKNGSVYSDILRPKYNSKWEGFSICDTMAIDSIKLIVDSTSGWIYIDDLSRGTFKKESYLGRKSVDKEIELYNLKSGNYYVYMSPIDAYGNRGKSSGIFNFNIETRAKAYIWPSIGGVDKLRHISIDDTARLTGFYVFTLNGKRVQIDTNLDERTFLMPDNKKYGIYYFVAKTEYSLYRGKFVITH